MYSPDIDRTASKMSTRLSGIIPGSPLVPIMVYVLPLPVLPYANTVPFCPLSTPEMSALAVFWYTSLFVALAPKALSNVYRRSFVRCVRSSR